MRTRPSHFFDLAQSYRPRAGSYSGREDGIGGVEVGARAMIKMEVDQSTLYQGTWQRCFAWYPVWIRGRPVWLKWIEQRLCLNCTNIWLESRLPDTDQPVYVRLGP